MHIRTLIWHERAITRRLALFALSALVVLSMFGVFGRSVEASEFTNRSLKINTPAGSATAQYLFTFGYKTHTVVGSLVFQFCNTPLPTQPCAIPPGLDVQNAFLGAQTGQTGYSIVSANQNQIIIGRPAQMPGSGPSTYLFDNITNPSTEPQVVYVRISSYPSSDGSGALIDEGAVAATTVQDIELYTQVPPVLIFCVATVVNDSECNSMDGNYTDLGALSPTKTSMLTAQMQARTNARSGYTIQMTGNTLSSGINTIPALTTPTSSVAGVGQFGMNLAANTIPAIGSAPTGPGLNAVINGNYTIPNQFIYNDGDVLVTSTNPTRSRKFTLSYIVNVPEGQPLGVYSTTITFVCIGGF